MLCNNYVFYFYLQSLGLEAIEFSLSKVGEKPLLKIKGPVNRLQMAKIDVMSKLMFKIQCQYIPISEQNQILFSSPNIRECFSKVVENAKIKCAFELFEAEKSAGPAGNKEYKICFVALDRIQLEHAIGDLYTFFERINEWQ